MKKIATILFLISTFFLSSSAFCQDFSAPLPKTKKEKSSFPDMDKMFFGGGGGVWFDTRGAYLNLAPYVGYKITEKFSAGLGVTYMYVSDKRYKPPHTINIYGGNIFSRYLLTDYIFAHAEYEPLYGNWFAPYDNKRFFIQNVWVGGGFRQAAENSSFYVLGLWNLNDQGYVQNPQIRVGIGIDL